MDCSGRPISSRLLCSRKWQKKSVIRQSNNSVTKKSTFSLQQTWLHVVSMFQRLSWLSTMMCLHVSLTINRLQTQKPTSIVLVELADLACRALPLPFMIETSTKSTWMTSCSTMECRTKCWSSRAPNTYKNYSKILTQMMHEKRNHRLYWKRKEIMYRSQGQKAKKRFITLQIKFLWI